MLGFYKKVLAKYFLVVSDFKTAEKKFLDQGEDKTEVKKYLELFKKLRDKNKLSDQERNIDLWAKKPFKDFKKRLDELEQEKTNTEKRKGAVNTAKEVSGAKKIKEDDNWVIYEILTNKAAAELGQGTEWCIKYNPSENWNNYFVYHNIYYLISKTLSDKDPWDKIAFLIDKKGRTYYWDALDRGHSSVPKELKIPQFKYEKPTIWKYSDRDLDVSGLSLTSLEGAPEKVGGNFSCSRNQLTSLVGAPKEVGGNFDCSQNQLKSLVGAPKEVGGYFDCYQNQLKSLKGAPKEVGGDFYCSRNQLTSLEGAPKEVGGNFDCSENQLKSLEGAPKEVGGNFYCYENQLKSLEGAPKEVGGNFSCYQNQLKSLEGAPEKVGGDFDCYENQLKSLKGAPKEVGGDFYCSDQKSGKKFTEEEVRAVCKVRGNVHV